MMTLTLADRIESAEDTIAAAIHDAVCPKGHHAIACDRVPWDRVIAALRALLELDEFHHEDACDHSLCDNLEDGYDDGCDDGRNEAVGALACAPGELREALERYGEQPTELGRVLGEIAAR